MKRKLFVLKGAIKKNLPSHLVNVIQYFSDTARYKYRVLVLRDLRAKFVFLKHLFSKKGRKRKEQRILGIVDLRSDDFSIGNFIELQLCLLCMSILKKTKLIDLAFVYDITTQKHFFDLRNSALPSSNYYHYVHELFPLLPITGRLGSVFFFDLQDDFELFLERNKNKYFTYPSYSDYLALNSIYRPLFKIAHKFYLKKGYLPKLKMSPETTAWAKLFIKKELKDSLMVVVCLRQNPVRSVARNANLKEWEKFFEFCLEKHKNVKFVLTGRKDEVEKKLKKLPNLFFSKEYNTNIEQELALIQNSLFFMGTCSGPASFSFLSEDIPYIITKFVMPSKMYNYDFSRKNRFPWQNTQLQHLLAASKVEEKSEVLIKEFEQLLKLVDEKKWRESICLSDVEKTEKEIMRKI